MHFLVRIHELRGSFRLYSNSELRTVKEAHSSILSDVLEHETFSMRADKIKKIYHFRKPFEVVIPSRKDWIENWIISIMDGVVVFTDKCKTSEATGYGIYGDSPKVRKIAVNLGRYTTAEIFAVLQET